MFLEIVGLVHFILLTVSMIFFSPLQGVTPEYKKLFVRSLPIFSLLSVFIPVFIIAYLIYGSSLNYVDSFNNKAFIFLLIVVYSIVNFIVLLILVWKELQNISEDLKNEKLFLVPALFLFLYTSSVLLSGIFLDFSNRVFDFSKAEEHIVSVSGGGNDNDNDNYLYIDPYVYNKGKLSVSISSYNKVKSRSKLVKIPNDNNKRNNYAMTNQVKAKVYVYKGLYGVRYIGKSIDVL